MSTQLTIRQADDIEEGAAYVEFVLVGVDYRGQKLRAAIRRDCRWFAGEVRFCWGLYVSVIRSFLGR